MNMRVGLREAEEPAGRMVPNTTSCVLSMRLDCFEHTCLHWRTPKCCLLNRRRFAERATELEHAS